MTKRVVKNQDPVEIAEENVEKNVGNVAVADTQWGEAPLTAEEMAQFGIAILELFEPSDASKELRYPPLANVRMTLTAGTLGQVTLSGIRIMPGNSGTPFVSYPGFKGTKRFLENVRFNALLERFVLRKVEEAGIRQ